MISLSKVQTRIERKVGQETFIHCRKIDVLGGLGNSIMVSISLCHAGRPGSSLVRSICVRKVEFYQHAVDLSPPVLTTGSTNVVQVLSCLCDNACKRSLAICCNSRASCPISRLLSGPILLACAEQGC